MPVGYDYWLDKYYSDYQVNQETNSVNKGDYSSNGGAFVQPTSAVGASGSSGSGIGGVPSNIQDVWNAMNDFNIAQTNMVNEFNAREAQKNRDWQERMSRNAHQYEVEDLIKAGLNPVLSAGGQGAYVGSGAVASGQKAVADDTLSRAALAMLNNSMNSAGAVAAGAAQSGKYSDYTIAQIWRAIIGGASHIIGRLLSPIK